MRNLRGKGINVSRVLQTLQVPSTALGFIGGFPGQFIENTLKAEGIHTAFTQVDEDTRINVKVKSQTETEINAAGPHITETQVATLFEQLHVTTAEDIVVVAGSVLQVCRTPFISILQRSHNKQAQNLSLMLRNL